MIPLWIPITEYFRRMIFLFSFISSAPDPHHRAFPADEFLIFLRFVRSGSSSPCVSSGRISYFPLFRPLRIPITVRFNDLKQY